MTPLNCRYRFGMLLLCASLAAAQEVTLTGRVALTLTSAGKQGEAKASE